MTRYARICFTSLFLLFVATAATLTATAADGGHYLIACGGRDSPTCTLEKVATEAAAQYMPAVLPNLDTRHKPAAVVLAYCDDRNPDGCIATPPPDPCSNPPDPSDPFAYASWFWNCYVLQG